MTLLAQHAHHLGAFVAVAIGVTTALVMGVWAAFRYEGTSRSGEPDGKKRLSDVREKRSARLKR